MWLMASESLLWDSRFLDGVHHYWIVIFNCLKGTPAASINVYMTSTWLLIVHYLRAALGFALVWALTGSVRHCWVFVMWPYMLV